MFGLILFLVMGLIAGAIARFVLPGADPMGLGGTMLLGVIGSFIGGAIGALLSGGSIMAFNTVGLIGSVLGAIIALLVYRKMR